MNKREYLANTYGSWLPPQLDDDAVDFYYDIDRKYNMNLYDGDEYAHVCTYLGYDIGAEKAKAIANWYYENGSTCRDAINVETKETFRNIMEMELGFYFDYSKWPTEEPKAYRYDWYKGGKA